MKGIWLYTTLILTLFLATSLLLLLLNLPSSSFGNLIGIRVFVFSVFGTAICSIFGKTSPLSEDELDGVVRFFNYFVSEDDGKLEIEKDYSDVDHDDDDNDDNDSYDGSDGYEEDNDDNGSSTDYEVESCDDVEEDEKEKVDEDLIRRSEEFIWKVKERWRQEMMARSDQEL